MTGKPTALRKIIPLPAKLTSFFAISLYFHCKNLIYMKRAKLLLTIAIACVLFTSCKREETLSYTCLCYSSTAGSTYKEVHELDTDDHEEAKELCE